MITSIATTTTTGCHALLPNLFCVFKDLFGFFFPRKTHFPSPCLSLSPISVQKATNPYYQLSFDSLKIVKKIHFPFLFSLSLFFEPQKRYVDDVYYDFFSELLLSFCEWPMPNGEQKTRLSIISWLLPMIGRLYTAPMMIGTSLGSSEWLATLDHRSFGGNKRQVEMRAPPGSCQWAEKWLRTPSPSVYLADTSLK